MVTSIVSVRNKYKDMLHRYVDEYQIMLAFKGGRRILSAATILQQNRMKTGSDGMFLSGWNC